MTIYFEWKSGMSVEEENIDKQHQKLLEQLNKIIDAMVFGVTSKEVQEAVSFFEGYFKEHFFYEESYMEKHNYPFLGEHKTRHADFIKKYFSFKEKLNSDFKHNELIIEIEAYLGKWWIEHIGKEDQEYHNFIKKLDD
jgi:hemerythrin-like metal-binding protein